MANYQAVSRERHAMQRWQPSSGYRFAAQEAVVPLVAGELSKAMMSLPIAFIEQSGGYVPAAVLSLIPGKDLFVAESGSWAGDYIPSALRSFPFRLGNTSDGQQVLCIDEDSGLISDGPEGEPFFNEDGTPVQAILDIINFLNQVEQNHQHTVTACLVLHKYHLIRPWLINLKSDTGEQAINGLFQIDEAALNQLSAEALLEVRNAGALPIAYAQLFSMQHLPLLGQMIEAHGVAVAQSLQQLATNDEGGLAFLKNSDTIGFVSLL